MHIFLTHTSFPTIIVTYFYLHIPSEISIGTLMIASGSSSATSSILIPPWADAIITGPWSGVEGKSMKTIWRYSFVCLYRDCTNFNKDQTCVLQNLEIICLIIQLSTLGLVFPQFVIMLIKTHFFFFQT